MTPPAIHRRGAIREPTLPERKRVTRLQARDPIHCPFAPSTSRSDRDFFAASLLGGFDRPIIVDLLASCLGPANLAPMLSHGKSWYARE
jgi:hypothetical protein